MNKNIVHSTALASKQDHRGMIEGAPRLRIIPGLDKGYLHFRKTISQAVIFIDKILCRS